MKVVGWLCRSCFVQCDNDVVVVMVICGFVVVSFLAGAVRATRFCRGSFYGHLVIGCNDQERKEVRRYWTVGVLPIHYSPTLEKGKSLHTVLSGSRGILVRVE